MRRSAALVAAVLAGAGGASAVPLPGVNQAVIDSDAMPAKLSAFGLFLANNPKLPLNATPYDLHTPLFSDYADKARFISLPAGQRATVSADGRIEFPVGTVLAKSFGWAGVNDGRPVETRLLIHRAGGWVALPYVWDADGKDATLKVAGTRVPVTFRAADGTAQTISYAVPNKNQCKECHSLNGAIVPIGPKAWNMELGAGVSADSRKRLFANAAALKPAPVRWNDPKSGSLDSRARAYLDVNCAHCHNPAGSASNSGLFLGRDVTDAKALGIGKRPVAAGRGSGGREFAIAPGDPDASILIYRLESIEPGIAMPEVGRGTVHREGAALLRQWIAAMPKDGG
ncbi:MAG: SO2930 family diheme c-type cytochrome [Sphingopyxis sp.]|nr:SO2930 family diheme c-type cytochrome [Sphingopyxis sp.]